MERVWLLIALAALGAVVAAVIRTRLRTDAPIRPAWAVPDHVDRAELVRPDAPWMVVVFSSTTCMACRSTWDKVQILESDDVAVQDVDSVTDAALHERYGVDAVPLLLVLDADGRVRRHFLGEPTATDLWTAVAEAREEPAG